MNFIISQPKFSSEVSKAYFVVLPCFGEVDASVETHLQHCPASPHGLHVTVNFKATIFGIWCNSVGLTASFAYFVVVRAIYIY